MPALSFRDVTLDFAAERGPVRALDGVSFDVGRGRTVALVGESGSGKSSLALAAMGLLPPDAKLGGAILLDDAKGPTLDLAALKPASRAFREVRGRRIGFVFQEPLSAFSPVHPVGAQIAEAARANGDGAKAARARAIEMLRLAGFPDPARGFDAYPFELSGGLRQRAMIAAALAGDPAILIADEPTTALDVTVQAQALALIDRLKRDMGLSVLFITHDLGVVASIADDLVVLNRGRVMERGTADGVFAQGGHPYFAALREASPRLATRAAATAPPPAPEPLIEARDIVKAFQTRRGGGAAKALDRVSLSIAHGESVGLVGESGSGKSTLAKIIMRAVEPDAGEVIFHHAGEARNLAGASAFTLARYRRRVAYVFQDPYAALNPRMSVRDTLVEPLLIHRAGNAATREARARELLDLVGLPVAALDRYPPAFSGGQRQRIAIARALALKPELVILDEPTSALDVSVQAQILDLLASLRRELDVAYLFISHDLAVVEQIADRVAVMRRGRIVEEGPAALVFADPRHAYTQALVAAAPEADRARRLDLAAFASPAPGEAPRDGALIDIAPGRRIAREESPHHE